MTEATRDLINILEGPLGPRLESIETLAYEKPLRFDGEQVTLFKANHILGAGGELGGTVESPVCSLGMPTAAE